MLFKSKLFWISTALVICVMVFFAVTYYHAKQPSEPIIIYKDVVSEPREKQQFSEGATKTKQTRYDTADEMDTTDTNPTNLSENPFTDTDDESNDPITANGQADDLKIDTEAEEAAYNARQAAKLRTKISNVLQERIDLYDMINDLADFGVEDTEPFVLRQQLQEEAEELRKNIFKLIDEYASYTMDDTPFQPGGEFSDLMEQNGIALESEELTLEEINNLR